MVYGLSIAMSDMTYNFGGDVDHWYGQARTMPYAAAADDAFDHEIAIFLLPATTRDLSKVLGFSFLDNGLEHPSEDQETLVFWSDLNREGNLAIRAGLVLEPAKFEILTATLKRHHAHPMRLMIFMDSNSILQKLDVSTGNSRKEFLNRVPILELVKPEFGITQLDTVR